MPQPSTLLTLSNMQKDIPYCDSTDEYRTFDFYRPKNKPNETIPLLVYIHGGGWRSGDKRNPLISTYGPLFIEQGMAVASINYRLHTDTPYPDQNYDVACALDYLSEYAEKFNIDTERTVYFGESAGGQLAAFAALNIPYTDYDYDAPVGVIDFYGVSDFSKVIEGAHPDFNARRYLGSKYNLVAGSASPTTYVTKHAPRFLFVHGTADTIVSLSQSKILYDLLVKAGIEAQLLPISGAKHGFTGPELPPRSYTAIRDHMNSFIRKVLNE